VRARRPARLELMGLLAILVLAALTRLPGIDARGQWDADQGHDMLVLHALVTDGEIPLLGPKTSIGTFHHGALYYYLLAPAAAISNADPVAVTIELALLGIAAVAATWWLARLVGGPMAALAAGLLAAVSPAGIDESTFIWNPNPIPLFAALALGGAILGRRTGRARWWLLAGLGAMAVMQLHVLGIVIMVPLGWIWASAVLRTRRLGEPLRPLGESLRPLGEPLRPLVLAGAGALAIVAAGYLPLLAHELGHGFEEVRAMLAYAAGGGREASAGLATRFVLVALRSVTWPLTGLITDRVAVSVLVAVAAVAIGTIAVMGRRTGDVGHTGTGPSRGEPGGGGPLRGEPDAPGPLRGSVLDAHSIVMDARSISVMDARWLAGTLGWSVLALAAFAPSLATVTPGLPNDHYHSLLDPVVMTLVATGLARIWGARGKASPNRGATPGRLLATVAAAALLACGVTAWPPAVSPDGGWPGADAAAARVRRVTEGRPLALDGLPSFKSSDALGFPLLRRGADIVDPGDHPSYHVLVCDPLFNEVMGLPCGGPAEAAWMQQTGVQLLGPQPIDGGSRRWISVYQAATQP